MAAKNPNSRAVGAPDFAYPQTVSKNAHSDLKKAIAAHDAHAALNALIRLYVADNMVDRTSDQTTYYLVLETADKFQESPLRGIFSALAADVLNGIYGFNKWNYDRRELPFEPMSHDLTEWSGEQFKLRLRQLCQESVSAPLKLAQCPIRNYSDIVTADALTAIYYPTLMDFAYERALYLYGVNDMEGADDLIAAAMAGSNPGSPGYLLWLSKKCELDYENAPSDLRNAYMHNRNNEYASLLLVKYYNSSSHGNYGAWSGIYDPVADDEEENNPAIERQQWTKWMVSEIDYMTAKHGACPLRNQLLYYKQQLTRPTARLTVPSLCSPGHEFNVCLTVNNAAKTMISIYLIPEYALKEDNNYKMHTLGFLKTLKPLRTMTVDFAAPVPFEVDSLLPLTIDWPGSYAIVPTIVGQETDRNEYVDFVRCTPVYPLAFSYTDKSYAFALDPGDGSPIKDVSVELKDKSNTRACGVTDSKGMLDITNYVSEYRYPDDYLVYTYQGAKYEFASIRPDIYSDNYNPDYNTASVLTDRALYHPGDSLHALIVVTNTRDIGAKVAKGLPIRVELYDANSQLVNAIDGISDGYGRLSCEFMLPEQGLTGRFRITVKSMGSVIGSSSVTVSDYRMPDFEIDITSVARDVPAKGCVTITGRAMMYSGMPLANATVDAIVSTASWWRWFSPQQKIYSTEVTTNSDGSFTMEIADSVLSQVDDKYFMARFDATSPSGTSASASVPFSVGKQYMIDLTIGNNNVNGQELFKPQVQIYAPDGKTVELPLTWKLLKDKKELAGGELGNGIDLSTIEPGTYTLSLQTRDPELADAQRASITIYNQSSDKVPGTEPLWICQSSISIKADEKSVNLLYGTTQEDTWVYYNLVADNSLVNVDMVKAAQGYHVFNVSLPDGVDEAVLRLFCVRDSQIYTYSVLIKRSKSSGLSIVGESFRDKLVPTSEEAWSIKIVDGNGRPIQAALVLDMYNHALDAIQGHSLSLHTAGDGRRSNNLRYLYLYRQEYSFLFRSNYKAIKYDALDDPEFNMYGYNPGVYSFGWNSIDQLSRMRSKGKVDDIEMVEEYMDSEDYCRELNSQVCYLKESSAAPTVEAAGAVADAEVEFEEETKQIEEQPVENVDYRDADVPLAIWAPMLETDSNGELTYKFVVPNANTTWRLRSVAWTRNWELGSMVRDFVASKPVMVQPNVPRFLRAGDKAKISTLVLNNTDSEAIVTTKIEYFEPVTGRVINTVTHTDNIPANGNVTVTAELTASADWSAVGCRVSASSGRFTDGEQSMVRILPSATSLIETTPFYLNPGDTEYTAMLPKEKNAKITLTFTENPAWSIVTALPGLRQDAGPDANSIMAALFSAAISQGIANSNPEISRVIKEWQSNPNDSALISMLEKNEDLKQAVLNATPWMTDAQNDTERMARLALIFDRKLTSNTIKDAIESLEKLQKGDGGWTWGTWCETSSVWVTGNILEGFGALKRLGWLPKSDKLDKMIAQALNYYDSKVEDIDILYALTRPAFKDTPISLNGQKVIAKTVQEALKDWKEYTNPVTKAMAAEAMYLNDYPAKAREVMSSVSEFGVWSQTQGLTFPSVNSLVSYGILLDAYAMIMPQSREVDGLRQQLIVRKQATDWGSPVVTQQVVTSILLSGSNWLVTTLGAQIEVGNERIEPQSPVESATGYIRANLSGYAGKQLKITVPSSGPSYGAIYAQFDKQINEVKSYSCDDLSIEKQMMVRRGTEWEYVTADNLSVGDRVRVQLVIHSQRPLQYVTIIDERPAAFMPVNQVPGWIWSEGVGFYRENRNTFTGLYVEYMRPGTYMLTYDMNVGTAGEFLSGIATIQSQYAPEISAHSAGSEIKVK